MSKIHRICDHTFFGADLGPESVVVDLGANRGQFAKSMEDFFGCNVLAVEASPKLFKELVSTDRVKYVNFAICDKVQEVPFNVSFLLESSSLLRVPLGTQTDTVNVSGLTLEELFKRNGITKVDLLKVDIEGAELGMLEACSDDTLKQIGQISVEFHDFCGLMTEAEVDVVLTRLRALEFEVIKFSKSNFDVLFVNPRLVRLSSIELLWAKTVLRFFLGLHRRFKKRFCSTRTM